MKIISGALMLLSSVAIYSQELETIKVKGVEERLRSLGKLKDTTIQTSVVDSDKIQRDQSGTLADIVKNETGIDSREGCSICGMRRVRINGLKGEHTTVLNDGVPLNSTVSSFYGFDAIGSAGIEKVEISRGAGASLIAPEAIGGVINIVKKKPTTNESFLDVSFGNEDYKKISASTSTISSDGEHGTTISGQYLTQGQWDHDGNGVNESPRLDSHFLTAKHVYDVNSRTSLHFDVTMLTAETFGGPMQNSLFNPTVGQGGGLVFEGGDVRQRYIGDPMEVNETIITKRNEYTTRYIRQIDDASNFLVTASYAMQIQDSYYEGADYYHTNQTFFGDVQYNRQLNDSHFFTIGIDNKIETLKSESHVYFVDQGRPKDNYDYKAPGLYLRNIWTPNETSEYAFALRANQINVDWTDQTAQGDEIDKFMLAPRFHAKYGHTDSLTSRLGLGVGYRAPLTFFESEHGLLDDGFEVAISEVETSKSVTYSLSHDTERTTAVLSGSYTSVKNLAFVDDSGLVPTLRNYDDEVSVRNFDATFGYQITSNLSAAISFEIYDYDQEYKELLFLAAIEQRAKLDVEWENEKWRLSSLLIWTGSRNLDDYGYGGRFNVWDGTTASSEKSTTAPDFFTLDLKAEYKFHAYSIYAGVKNAFDYVQDESPLFFDDQGEFDVGHIWGPLRGRQVYVGMTSVF